jgi:hypothetical protein
MRTASSPVAVPSTAFVERADKGEVALEEMRFVFMLGKVRAKG